MSDLDEEEILVRLAVKLVILTAAVSGFASSMFTIFIIKFLG